MIKRVEHFGSSAVPGMPAKPIVDMLVYIKLKAFKKYRHDRAGYTQAKTDFIDRIMKIAKEHYGQTS